MRHSQPMSLDTLSHRPALQQQAATGNRPAMTEHDARVVNTLLAQLKIIFPAWGKAFPTAQAEQRANQEWTKALVEANCTRRDQLERGMRVARQQDIPFFPSPGMFIKWCELTPESLGLPSVDQAFDDVARRRRSHPAVVLAARATRFERQTLTADEYRPVFAQAYEQLVRRLMAGEDLDAELHKALPSREQVTHSPEYYHQTGRQGVAKLKALLRGRV